MPYRSKCIKHLDLSDLLPILPYFPLDNPPRSGYNRSRDRERQGRTEGRCKVSYNTYFSKTEATAYSLLLNRIYGPSYVLIVDEGKKDGYTIRLKQEHVDGSTYTISTYQDVIDVIQMGERKYDLPGTGIRFN